MFKENTFYISNRHTFYFTTIDEDKATHIDVQKNDIIFITRVVLIDKKSSRLDFIFDLKTYKDIVWDVEAFSWIDEVV